MSVPAGPVAVRHTEVRVALLGLAVWLSLMPPGHAQEREPGPATRGQAELALERGNYSEAERVSRALIDPLERDQPDAAVELCRARDLLLNALIGAGRAADPLTLNLSQDNLAATERLQGPDGLDAAASRHTLADVLFQRGEFQKALPLHETSLAVRVRLLPPTSEAIADSLERLARTQMRLERYDAARSSLERARTIREGTVDSSPLKLAHLLDLFAWVDRYAGNYDRARNSLTSAQTIRQSAGGGSVAIDSVELDGDLQILEGNVADARRRWSDARERVANLVRPDHPVLAALERRLAFASDAMGDRQEGSLHLRRGLDIAQATLAPCNPERVGLEDLAATYLMRDGQFIAAREQYEQALAACRRCLGDTHSITASVMFNLAELTANIGDFADAERLYNTVISVWSSQRRDHPYVARALDALAQVVEARGDPQRARALYERALVIRRRVRPDHPDVAWTLTNLARVTADAGSPVLALRYLEQALEIYERVGTADVPDHLERALELRGEILGRRHDYAGALTNFSEALDNRERFFGASHPLAAQTRSRLAWAEWGLGSSEEALRLSLSAEEAGRAHFRDTARYLPEREALAYAATRPNGLSLALSIAVAGDTANGAVVMDSEIRSRSMVLDELGARTKSANNPDPAITMLEADLAVKRQRFANLMLQSMAGDASPALTAMLRDATQQKEAAERALASQSAAFRSELDRSGIGFNEVTRALPPGTALVSYVRYERSVAQTSSRAAGSRPDQIPNSRILQSVPSYVAFVLRSDSPDPWVLPLGSASAIEALIRGWRAEIVERHTLPPEQSGASTLGGQLRRRIWDPAAAHLADIKEVFIVPDGDINLIPFAALPVARGGYLLEHGPLLHYLSAERDLVSLSDTSGLRGSGLLAIGGPAFSNPSSFTARPKNGVAANSARNDVRGACGDLGTLRFADLPASMFEAESVLSLSRQSRIGDGTGDDRLLSGADATEAAFKAFGPGHRIVHLATHGFVLGADCVATVAGLRGVGGLTPVGVARAANTGRPARRAEPGNPLLLSGLAFAGANERRTTGPDADDGILTAEEVAGMNLSGVEWAVLSACDTGLGEIRAGEGVFGLRRAFQVAGVRTVIMSLWPVEDVATRQWMEALYRARLGDRLDTAEAVRQASLTLIRERRARGQSTDLFYWAAFVAAGDWR